MSIDLEASYLECRRVTRAAASNFYRSFHTLPRDKQRGMWALYAFLRQTDDLGDRPGSPEARRAELLAWRDALHAAQRGEFTTPIFPALVDTLRRYAIPPCLLEATIDGVLRDQQSSSFETFEHLQGYCYQVAGAVGLACLHIWGCPAWNEEVDRTARRCGEAFQLTNILRDLREDAEQGRCYLPLDELEHFGCRPDQLCTGRVSESFRDFMRFQLERVGQLYDEAAPLERHLHPDGQRIFRTMFRTYHALFDEIRRRDGDVLHTRVRIRWWRRWEIAARAWLGAAWQSREES